MAMCMSGSVVILSSVVLLSSAGKLLSWRHLLENCRGGKISPDTVKTVINGSNTAKWQTETVEKRFGNGGKRSAVVASRVLVFWYLVSGHWSFARARLCPSLTLRLGVDKLAAISRGLGAGAGRENRAQPI